MKLRRNFTGSETVKKSGRPQRVSARFLLFQKIEFEFEQQCEINNRDSTVPLKFVYHTFQNIIVTSFYSGIYFITSNQNSCASSHSLWFKRLFQSFSNFAISVNAIKIFGQARHQGRIEGSRKENQQSQLSSKIKNFITSVLFFC